MPDLNPLRLSRADDTIAALRRELATERARIAAALVEVDSMISQLVSGPELDDAHAIRAALKGENQ